VAKAAHLMEARKQRGEEEGDKTETRYTFPLHVPSDLLPSTRSLLLLFTTSQ
jgi:hypothetical protein